jgi:aspartyl protease family protein
MFSLSGVIKQWRRMLMQGLILPMLFAYSSFTTAASMQVEGLMNNMAVLKVNGVQRIVKVGQTTPEGIRLLSSTPKEAVLLINGEKQKVGLSGHISGSYQAPKRATVSIQQKHGQYITAGSINGRPVQFLVDTGATSVTMSLSDARRLGVSIDKSKAIYVATAGGRVIGYPVILDSVKVGGLKVSYVRGVALESGFSGELLLGMSFLKHVSLKDERGFLVLEQNL